MFPNNIDLKIIKRCDSDVIYKIKNLIELNKDLDDDSELIKYIVNKFFKNKIIKDIGDIKTGISYTNETKTIMNNKIHKKIYNHNNFIIG
jgi:mannitol/fructose-specific phosphotransferase system IIA component (Ntr-type)